MTQVLNIAHRGGAGLWPENTMAAFRHALDMGCDGIELDCHLSRDSEVVVFHDEALKPELVRDANGQWLERSGALIKDLTFANLQAFDIGRVKPGTPYAARNPAQQAIDGERIPLLRDVIRLTKAKSATARLWVELKTSLFEPHKSSTPQALAEAVVALVHREEFVERTTFVAFDWAALIHAKHLEPRVETRFTTLAQSWFADGEPPPEHGPPPLPMLEHIRQMNREGAPWEGGFHPRDHGSLQHAVKAAGGDGWFPFYPDVTAETAERTRALGLKLAAWTVNKADDMRRLIALGCDAICTDRPDVLRQVLRAHSAPA